MDTNRVLVIDLDGTITHKVFPLIGTFIHGAVEALIQLEREGWKCVVSSCRNNTILYRYAEERDNNLAGVLSTLRNAGLVKTEIDWGNKGKPIATWHIDDQGVKYDGNWQNVLKYFSSLENKHNLGPLLSKTIAIGIENCILDSQCSLIPDTVESLYYLISRGYRIILTTTASNRVLNDSERKREAELKHIKGILIKNRVPFHWFDQGLTGKPIADYYIDANAIPFRHSWSRILDTIAAG